MKIFVLTIVIFAIGVHVTRATSLDPSDHVEIDDAKNDNDDTRTKRSGDIFSSLLKKKLGLIGSLSGTSSGKSIDHQPHYEEPLSYNTKSFNLWGVKKAIMSSVFQAAKAITGGVIALKGQLIKAKGHVVVAKGKLMQTKGEAISNFGKTIATHAFDTHHDSHNEGPPSSIGLFNHLPVTPIHQPTSYGAATAIGYQGQVYSGNAYPVNAYSGNSYASHAYPNNAYQVAAQSYQTGYVVPQTGYEGGSGYIGYGGNGFTAKRAVQSAQESTNNQAKSDSDKDSLRAGLVIFKPIKMPQSLPGSTAATQSIQQMLSQRPTQSNGIRPTEFKTLQSTGFQNSFPAGFQGPTQSSGFQGTQVNGFQGAQTGGFQGAQSDGYPGPQTGGYQLPQANSYQLLPQADGYSTYQNPGYQAPTSQYRFPANGGGDSVEQIPSQGYQLQSFEFQQPASSQEFEQQLAAFSGQQPQQGFSQENNYGSDQHDSASSSEERVAEPTAVRGRQATRPKQKAADRFPGDFFLPTTARYSGEDSGSGESDVLAAVRSKKRSAPKKDDSDSAPSSRESIVPLKYHNGSNEEDQARLKQTVQRFFSMLQKQR